MIVALCKEETGRSLVDADTYLTPPLALGRCTTSTPVSRLMELSAGLLPTTHYSPKARQLIM